MGNSESRIAFSESLEHFLKADETDDPAIERIIDVPVSIEDVFEIVTPDAIRDIQKTNPSRLISLIASCTRYILSLRISSVNGVDGVTSTRLGSCVRLLSRVLPFINDSTVPPAVSIVLWNSPDPPNCLDDVDVNSVGYQLVKVLLRLPFIHGYTIPVSSSSDIAGEESQDPTRVDPSLVWGKLGGLAGLPRSRAKPPVSHQMLMNRIEVTRLIIISLTSPLFQSITEYKKSVPMINQLFVSGDSPHTSDFVVSLFIYILEYETWHYAVPVLSNTILASDLVSPEEQLLDNCLNIINILVDPLPTSNNEYVNVFRDIFSGTAFSEPQEIAILSSSFREKLLSIYSRNSSFKFSLTNKLKNFETFILFLYNVVSMNPRILAGSFDHTLIHALLFILQTRSGTQNSSGLIHTVSFILLAISGNREFVIDHMNKTYDKSIDYVLPQEISRITKKNPSNFQFFILIVTQLVKVKKIEENLLEIFFTTINNMAPFVTGFDSDSARAFVSVFEKFSRQNFSPKPPKYYNLLMLMLETIDNCVHYQYDQNPQLIYSLLQGGIGKKILANLPTEKQFSTETLMRLLNYIGPRIEEVCRKNEGNIDDSQVVELIRKISVIGILPVPHAIVIRQYAVNDHTRLWFTSYLWGTVFTALQYMPVLDWSRVQMVVLSGEFQKKNQPEETTAEI